MLIMHYQQAVEHHTSAQSCSYNDTIGNILYVGYPLKKIKPMFGLKKYYYLEHLTRNTFIFLVHLQQLFSSMHRLTLLTGSQIISVLQCYSLSHKSPCGPIASSPPSGHSLSDSKSTAVQRAKTQISFGKLCCDEHSYNVREEKSVLIVETN